MQDRDYIFLNGDPSERGDDTKFLLGKHIEELNPNGYNTNQIQQ